MSQIGTSELLCWLHPGSMTGMHRMSCFYSDIMVHCVHACRYLCWNYAFSLKRWIFFLIRHQSQSWMCFFPLSFRSSWTWHVCQKHLATAPHHPALICIGIRNALNDAVSTVPSRNRWLWGWSLSKYKFPTCSKLGTNQWHSAAVQFTVECTCRFASKIWISGKKCRLIDSRITFIDYFSFTVPVMDKQSLESLHLLFPFQYDKAPYLMCSAIFSPGEGFMCICASWIIYVYLQHKAENLQKCTEMRENKSAKVCDIWNWIAKVGWKEEIV